MVIFCVNSLNILSIFKSNKQIGLIHAYYFSEPKHEYAYKFNHKCRSVYIHNIWPLISKVKKLCWGVKLFLNAIQQFCGLLIYYIKWYDAKRQLMDLQSQLQVLSPLH